MKRICVFFIVVFISFVSCSLPVKYPKDGIWYCEELKISVDFSESTSAEKSAKLYTNDGNYKFLTFHIGYGGEFNVYEEEEDDWNYYVYGTFKWKNNEIFVKDYEANKTYIFIRQ